MILALAALVLIQSVITVWTMHDALMKERARVNELLALLEAKAAPAEYAAYGQVLESIYPHPEPLETIHSDDGLISFTRAG